MSPGALEDADSVLDSESPPSFHNSSPHEWSAAVSPPPSIAQLDLSDAHDSTSILNEEEFIHIELTQNMGKLALSSRDRFFGSASTFSLAQSALNMRAKFIGESNPHQYSKSKAHELYWDFQPVN